MQTPYIIVWTYQNKHRNSDLDIPHRKCVKKSAGNFTFHFFPPDDEQLVSKFEKRIHQNDNDLWYEDGFMVRYPEPYIEDVGQKLEHFDLPSIELDGAYSRVSVNDGCLKIDGSATYLQTLYSFSGEGKFVFSNNLPTLESFLTKSGYELTLSDHFLSSHLIQSPLTYFMFAGTQWNEIQYHDSTETITFNGELKVDLEHKFQDDNISRLTRSDRLDMLHARLSHAIDQFCQWTDAEKITHHLTAGRDSRMSFSMFKEKHKDRLLIETGGHAHTTDKVLSNYISKQYELQQSITKQPTVGSGFSYSSVLAIKHPYRYQVALFRKQEYSTKFDPSKAVANGYLGNLAVYSGSQKQQILPREKTALSDTVYTKLINEYDEIIASLKSVYGDDAYRIFNLRYNTVNKISGTLQRLKKYSFCVFESDLFFLCYALEKPEDMLNNSLHYELLKRGDEYLANAIPFEPGKSFPETGFTTEVTEFKGIMRIGAHRKFIQLNYDKIVQHITTYSDDIPFLRTGYLDEIKRVNRDNIPVLVVNKLYALLGSLELKGIPLTDYTEVDHETEMSSDVYSVDFFQQVYLDGALHTSGLAGMVYSDIGAYRCFVKLRSDEKLMVSIVSIKNEERQKVDISKQEDGYTIRYELDGSGRYRVVHTAYNGTTKTRRELYRRQFVNQSLAAA